MKNKLLILMALLSFLLILLSSPVYADSLVVSDYVSPDDPDTTMAWANGYIEPDVTTYARFEGSSLPVFQDSVAGYWYWEPGIIDWEYAVIKVGEPNTQDNTYLFRDNGIPVIGDDILQISYSVWNAMTNPPSGKGRGISHVDIYDGSPVPEPATMLLIGSGLLGLAGLKRRFRKN